MEIEKAALEHEVVQRLSCLLERSRNAEYSTTEALSHFTAILAWVLQRVNGQGDAARILRERWKAKRAGEKPWCLPAPLSDKPLLEALVDLRNASSHAGSESSDPINWRGQLTGFKLGNARPQYPIWSVDLSEDQIRETGLRVAHEFVAAMRQPGNQ